MPAFYAHKRFGEMVAKELPEEIKEAVLNHEAQFLIGCQGPDIYFFFRPWKHNDVNAYGEGLHALEARALFERGAKIIRRYGRDSAKAAYVYGVLCHFALDSEAHPYVNAMVEKLYVGHIEIEEEFEKHMMRLDEVNPFSTDLSKMVPTDNETVDAIKPLYEGVTWKQTKESLKELKLLKKIVCQPTAAGQKRLNSLLKKAGMYEQHKGQMNQMVDNLTCRESNEGLTKKLFGAIPVAVRLMKELDDCAFRGTPLSGRFDRNFE